VFLVLSACRGKQAEPPPPPPAPPQDGVTLLQPGAAPWQPLRYHLTRGARTTSELAYDVGIKDDGQGRPLPTLVFELETAVDDVLPDGTAKLRITVGRTSVRDRPGSEPASELTRREAAAMQGVVITETLAPDGQVTDAHVQAAAALSEQAHAQLDSLSQGLERVAMRLPAEPVGVGATWRGRQTLPAGGIQAVSEITYTLTSRTGDTIAYTSAGQATGAPQTLEQDGLLVEVTSTRGHAEAQGTIDLSSYALEVRSTSTLATAMNVIAPQGTPGAGASTVEVTTALQLSPRPASPSTPADLPGAEPGRSVQGAHKAP
jgi:hypothetical protein